MEKRTETEPEYQKQIKVPVRIAPTCLHRYHNLPPFSVHPSVTNPEIKRNAMARFRGHRTIRESLAPSNDGGAAGWGSEKREIRISRTAKCLEHEKPIARGTQEGWWIVESAIARWASGDGEDRHIVYSKNSVFIKLSGKWLRM